MMGRDVTNLVRQVVWHMFFLSFCFTREAKYSDPQHFQPLEACHTKEK